MDPKPLRAGKTQEKPCRNGDGHAARKLHVISPEESNFPGSSSILMELLDCFQSSLRGFSIVSSRFSARKQLPTCKKICAQRLEWLIFMEHVCMNMWPLEKVSVGFHENWEDGMDMRWTKSFQHLSALFRFTNIVRWLTPQVFLWAPPETCLPRLSDVPPTAGKFNKNRLCVKRNDLPTTMRWEWCNRSLMSLVHLNQVDWGPGVDFSIWIHENASAAKWCFFFVGKVIISQRIHGTIVHVYLPVFTS